MELVLNGFVDTVAAHLHSWLPQLKTCERHAGRFDEGEVQRFATRAPAVQVALLEISDIAMVPSGERDLSLVLAAYVVTKNQSGLDREQGAINIVEGISRRIMDHTFGCAFGARGIRCTNLHSSGAIKLGCQIWGISWRQVIRVGEDMWAPNPDLTIPPNLYMGYEPDTGTAHLSDYDNLTLED